MRSSPRAGSKRSTVVLPSGNVSGIVESCSGHVAAVVRTPGGRSVLAVAQLNGRGVATFASPSPRSPRHRRAAGLATTVSARPSAAGRSMCRCYCCMSPPVPGGGPPPKPDSVPVTWKLESISTVTSVPSAFCMWPS